MDPANFKTTQWNLVRAANDSGALEALIRIYWKPLYFFVRHHGHDRETAKDVVQAFLMDLMERGAIPKADPGRGRFRTFLRAAMMNFLKDWSKNAARQKRRPARQLLSLDFKRGETDYHLQVAGGETAERVLNRAWARSLWDDALAQLKGERAHLEAFDLYLQGTDYPAISAKTGLSESTAKVVVHRMKGQLRELITNRIRETVTSEEDLRAELAEFKSLLS
ncbi:MAG TPA: sigma-70 family RNA polymerase sigma factor [Planctomycetota bacterium]|nr:sigma-70 family RNA polymerase sigma factor [Planctomycetota bacterium]